MDYSRFLRLPRSEASRLPSETHRREVARFLLVEKEAAFFFGPETRSVPLRQRLLGVKGRDPAKIRQTLDAVCYDVIREALQGGHQAMVFVHSRSGTLDSAQSLLAAASAAGDLELFATPAAAALAKAPSLAALLKKARMRDLSSLVERGVATHHAGMLRQDRALVERLFTAGAVRVLCCTATLAWGVNLPARCVVIKGTSVFSAKGAQQLGVFDVLQIFGRAGRPQFDSLGEGVLLTEQAKLSKYARLLASSLPVESRLAEQLPNALNAEVALGTVSSVLDAAEWLRGTFWFIRMTSNPTAFGLSADALADDPSMAQRRMALVAEAAKTLNEARLLRFHERAGSLASTDLGRVAARFYIDYETARAFREGLQSAGGDGGFSSAEGAAPLTDADVLRLVGSAGDFAQLKVREEETAELKSLRASKACPVRFRGDADSPACKVSTLIQCILAGVTFQTQSLAVDATFVAANAGRVCRALLAACLCDSVSRADAASVVLEWAKSLESGVRPGACVLRHFCATNAALSKIDRRREAEGAAEGCSKAGQGRSRRFALRLETAAKVERLNLSPEQLLQLSVAELEQVTASRGEGRTVFGLLRHVPLVELEVEAQPLSPHILKLGVKLTLDGRVRWSDIWNGAAEPFHVWVEERDTGELLYREEVALRRQQIYERNPATLSFALPLHEGTGGGEGGGSLQCIVRVISDRWVGVSACRPVSVKHLMQERQLQRHTPLLDIHPVPVTALQSRAFEDLYAFRFFNPVQSQAFHVCYHTDYNVLLGAPTGSGKTVVAELCLLRLFRTTPELKAVYIAPLKALANERVRDWAPRFSRFLNKRVVELTGDSEEPQTQIDFRKADVFVCTPEKWDGVSRQWRGRSFVRRIGLLIIDEIHLLGQERGGP